MTPEKDVRAEIGMTELPPDQEAKFQQWYTTVAKAQNFASDPNAYQHHYDFRAAFIAGAKADPKTGHWPSTFKTPAHPNRFVAVEGRGLIDTVSGKPLGNVRGR